MMQNISYVSGDEYVFLAITKKKAQEYGIENPNDIEIKATNNGILINRKSAPSSEPTADLDEESLKSNQSDTHGLHTQH